jgi:hypothetical protein
MIPFMCGLRSFPLFPGLKCLAGKTLHHHQVRGFHRPGPKTEGCFPGRSPALPERLSTTVLDCPVS